MPFGDWAAVRGLIAWNNSKYSGYTCIIRRECDWTGEYMGTEALSDYLLTMADSPV